MRRDLDTSLGRISGVSRAHLALLSPFMTKVSTPTTFSTDLIESSSTRPRSPTGTPPSRPS